MTTTPTEPKSQLDKFKDLARELECDEDEIKFDERLKKIGDRRPEPQKGPKPG